MQAANAVRGAITEACKLSSDAADAIVRIIIAPSPLPGTPIRE
jgi:hypothetical protein